MSCSFPVLLLTSSVYVAAPYVEVVEEKSRVRLMLDCLEHWVRVAPDLKIVVCDGSGYDFSEAVAERYPEAAIECLHFQNNKDAVTKFGKGFGEGEIIEYALEKSSFMRNSEIFAKCTGKLWVNNFVKVVRGFNGPLWCQLSVDNIWSISKIRPSFVDTRFYIVDKAFYTRYFLLAYKQVRDHDRHFLEHCFKDVIIKHGLNASRFLFPVPPSISGVSGSSGEVYGVENLALRRVTNRIKSNMLSIHERINGEI